LAFTGWMPPLRVFAMVVPFGMVAAALLTALYLGIGLVAFWLQDISPVFWVWQKLMFVLGGLMLPLALYPTFLQRLATLTPFPTLLAWPASFVLGPGTITAAALSGQLLIWSCVTGVALHAMFRRAVKELTINGG
jgi:ABC-2 type transport system permease protein